MKKEYEIYEGKRYLFYCRKCSKRTDDKKEFRFMHCRMIRNAVVRCCACGFVTSRHIRLLDEQIKEMKK